MVLSPVTMVIKNLGMHTVMNMISKQEKLRRKKYIGVLRRASSRVRRVKISSLSGSRYSWEVETEKSQLAMVGHLSILREWTLLTLTDSSFLFCKPNQIHIGKGEKLKYLNCTKIYSHTLRQKAGYLIKWCTCKWFF
jgi:hypothetical protein